MITIIAAARIADVQERLEFDRQPAKMSVASKKIKTGYVSQRLPKK